jgi:hypothetical protein
MINTICWILAEFHRLSIAKMDLTLKKAIFSKAFLEKGKKCGDQRTERNQNRQIQFWRN